jgi:hypothetical protein
MQTIAANGSALWSLRQCTRDPLSMQVNRFALTNLEFLIAVQMQLGLGLTGSSMTT